MRKRPRLSSLTLWAEFEALCMRTLHEALQDLATQSSIDQDEPDLNRDLYRAIIRASYTASTRGEYLPPVAPEGRNPPDASDEERTAREFKIPDFYWAYVDPYVDDPDHAAKQFVVECKRLTRPHAHYAREYVGSGITRFINVDHGYGKGMFSGAMVGYLQDIGLDDAFDRVNAIAASESIQPLTLKRRSEEDGGEFHHEVVRPFPVSPFRLTHVWARMGSLASTSDADGSTLGD